MKSSILKIWKRAHKTKFEGPARITFVAQTTVLDPNIGYQKANVLKSLGIGSLALERSLMLQDEMRVETSKRKKVSKKAGKKVKKNYYNPGGF